MKSIFYPILLAGLILCSVAKAENADYSRDEAYRGPHSAVVSQDQKFLYVTEFDAAKIAQIDTESCAVVKEILRGRIPGERVEIVMPCGHLSVRLRREGDRVTDIFLTGPTAVVEEGDFPLK